MKNKISLVMCPAWGVYFPPYNLSRLSAVLRNENYDVDVFDINVESYHILKSTGVDYWSGEKYFHWHEDNFKNHIFPILEDFLNQQVEKILAGKPDVVGFTLYETNKACSYYMMRRLKATNPEITIIVGGPECFPRHFVPDDIVDIVVVGEGEEVILDIMKDRPKSGTFGELRTRLNINNVPIPDYSDYDFSLYTHDHGVSIETSRGCIAKCTFCSETHFWKYRWRVADNVVDEMKDQISKYGMNHFWFIDSLINGNLKEFRSLIESIIDNDLQITWNGYTRCDGRMDIDFFKQMKKAGCVNVSYGIESGSQKVLDDMKKKITVAEVEANLKDGYEAGIQNHTNWVLGFPTEDKVDFYHTLVLIYNSGKYIYGISPGMGCGIASHSDIDLNGGNYEMADYSFLDAWYTKGYKNTRLHRFIRVKLFHIWLQIVTDYEEVCGQPHPNLQDQYTLSLKEEKCVERLEFDDINFHLLPEYSSQEVDFSSNIGEEFLPLFWAIYKTRGAFSMEIRFDAEEDIKEFGDVIGCYYNAKANFTATPTGDFRFDIRHNFQHKSPTNPNLKDSDDMSFDYGQRIFGKID